MSRKQGDLLMRGKGWKAVPSEESGLDACSRGQGDLLARGRGRKAVLLLQAALRLQRKARGLAGAWKRPESGSAGATQQRLACNGREVTCWRMM